MARKRYKKQIPILVNIFRNVTEPFFVPKIRNNVAIIINIKICMYVRTILGVIHILNQKNELNRKNISQTILCKCMLCWFKST